VRLCSNHFPIVLECDNIQHRKCPFQFKNMWLKVRGFEVKVKLWWDLYQFSGTPSYILDNKLKARKLDLKKWNESKFRNISTDKKKLVNDMLELDLVVDRRPLVAKEKVKKEQIQADLEKVILMEEISWRQESQAL
jgi:hypothetical protein